MTEVVGMIHRNGRKVYLVDLGMIDAVLATYNLDISMEASFLCETKDRLIAVDNTTGNAWTEVFKTMDVALDWLTNDLLDAEDAHRLDDQKAEEGM